MREFLRHSRSLRQYASPSLFLLWRNNHEVEKEQVIGYTGAARYANYGSMQDAG